jgi:hypothetical protein
MFDLHHNVVGKRGVTFFRFVGLFVAIGVTSPREEETMQNINKLQDELEIVVGL